MRVEQVRVVDQACRARAGWRRVSFRRVPGDDHGRGAVGDDGVHPGLGIRHREWHEDGADPQAGQSGDDEVDRVGEVQRHPLARGDTRSEHPECQLGDLVVECRVAEAAIGVLDGGMVGGGHGVTRHGVVDLDTAHRAAPRRSRPGSSPVCEPSSKVTVPRLTVQR